ncbi:Sucrase/ferredoxin-like-domain-containing protein [Phellopilus nigrolimitatus]|nr:Sucrase/ferredoxin-like-domain-containing protein [Phellopilus nigrolimitatus]
MFSSTSRACRRHPELLGRPRWLSASSVHRREVVKDNIVGTTPYHRSYLLLRHPDPPATYPSIFDSAFSPLYRDLMLRAKLRGGLVNFWWDAEAESAEVEQRQTRDDEHYPATLFAAPDPLHAWRARASGPIRVDRESTHAVEVLFDASAPAQAREADPGNALLLVCTHGARDCRCGDTGGAVARALKEELAARRARVGSADSGGKGTHAEHVWWKIRLGEIAHVGGHKHAANLLAFPSGDWLGNLTPADVPLVLDTVAAQLKAGSSRISAESTRTDTAITTALPEPLAPLISNATIWRGRMGLTKEEQIHLLEAHIQDPIPSVGRARGI